MTDLASFQTADTSFLHLKSPDLEEPMFETLNGEKVAVGITFHAPGSAPYEAATAKRTNRALSRSKRKIDLTADLLRSDTVTFLADVTLSFDNLGYSPAGDATGEALFKAAYSDRKLGWVVEQANAHLADWSSFTKGSPTS